MTAQRRWQTAHGGFSAAYPLNAFFAAFYAENARRDVFFVDGESNLADGPSRGNRLGQEVRVRTSAIAMPALAAFSHPFADDESPLCG